MLIINQLISINPLSPPIGNLHYINNYIYNRKPLIVIRIKPNRMNPETNPLKITITDDMIDGLVNMLNGELDDMKIAHGILKKANVDENYNKVLTKAYQAHSSKWELLGEGKNRRLIPKI